MEQQLSAGLGEQKIAKLVHNDEVEPCDKLGKTPLLTITRFRFKAIDQINYIEETATCAIANERARNGNGQMAFSCSRATNQNDISLIARKNACGQLANQTFVDWGAGKVEVLNVFSKR